MHCGGDATGPNVRKCADGQPNVETFLPYKPELVNNFEIGYKGVPRNKFEFVSRRLAMNYKDQQLTGTTSLANMCQRNHVLQINRSATFMKHGARSTSVTPRFAVVSKLSGITKRPGGVGGAFTLLDTKIHDYGSYSDDYNCDARG